MPNTTITEATKLLGLSTRTLRYYEQIGLINSERSDNYAYRVYSDDTLCRLQQIIVLRKLRIPLRSISEILQNGDARTAIDVFLANISEIDAEITALSTIRGILRQLTERLEQSVPQCRRIEFPSDIVSIVDALAVAKPKIKDEVGIKELNQASNKLEKLTGRDVRVIFLPPMTVASAHFVGANCEEITDKMISQFIVDTDLLTLKPDAREFGFNNPIAETAPGSPSHGYETWISIPDDLDVPQPLVKKQFFGGLYAVHTIDFMQFDHYPLFWNWVNENKYIEHAWEEIRWAPFDDDGDRCLEELLPNKAFRSTFPDSKMQDYLDILIPIKEKRGDKVTDIYINCPTFDSENFALRLIRQEDAADLLAVYADPNGQQILNECSAWACDFGYGAKNLPDMQRCISQWLEAYGHRVFVRLTVVDKRSGKAAGTLEAFRRGDGELFGGKICLRLDLKSQYENAETISELLALIIKDCVAPFGADGIVTRATPIATQRIKALNSNGFVLTDAKFQLNADSTVYADYWVKEKEAT
jgi:DNA-binding transcriptional MerR regulator/DNA gyrase inhibitor GyrI